MILHITLGCNSTINLLLAHSWLTDNKLVIVCSMCNKVFKGKKHLSLTQKDLLLILEIEIWWPLPKIHQRLSVTSSWIQDPRSNCIINSSVNVNRHCWWLIRFVSLTFLSREITLEKLIICYMSRLFTNLINFFSPKDFLKPFDW